MQRQSPNLMQQIMQRKVMRVLSLYLVTSFILLQVADITFEPLALPAWSMKLLIGILATGLPLALILSWIFDVTPQGVVRTGDVDPKATERFGTVRKIEAALIIVLGAALAFFIGNEIVQSESKGIAKTTIAVRSVAVLPFADVGSQNDYIAAGLTSELTNTLAAIPDLHVASYSFNNLSSDLSDKELGRSLHVAHLVKGTVQQMNDTLRVHAQVIRADDGRVLWSYQVDTMIEDIFAVQDEIANNVAQNLKSTLYREALRINAALRTDNLAAYDAYLLALKYHPTNWPLVLENASKAVELDPDFVPAHTLMADAYLRRVGGNMEFATAYPLARSSTEKALALAPEYGPALITMAHLERMARNYQDAEALFREAKRLAPNQPPRDLANFLLLIGRVDQSLIEHRRSMEIDPLNPGFYGATLFAAGAYEDALNLTLSASTQAVTPRARAVSAAMLSMWYTFLAQHGQANEWADKAAELIGGSDSTYAPGLLAYALARLGRTDEAFSIITQLEAQQRRQYLSPTGLFWAYFGVGDLDRAFLTLNRAVDENAFLVLMELKSSPILDELREDLRFVSVLDRMQLQEI